jgi:sulfate adenylyltransferase
MADLYLIAIGALSPLEGFMDELSYKSVVETMHLPSGDVFSVPVTLPVEKSFYDGASKGEKILLTDEGGTVQAVMTVESMFERDLKTEATEVYRTDEEAHPGVAAIYEQGPYCLGGPIDYVNQNPELEFPAYNLTPAQTRAKFEELGWETIVAFQTRNPIHRAHEYIIKVGMEIVDGLLLHPLVGPTKKDDIPADVRMECYHTILKHYFPQDRYVLSVLPAAMRYAGPREAIFHAIMRKNYGVTHFIVGRDHAGVGSYYGTYDAQKIFDDIDLEKFGLLPLKFEHSFWCKLTGQMATAKTSPAGKDDKIFLSGTKVREMLKNGELPPPEFSRPEVAKVLMQWAQNA